MKLTQQKPEFKPITITLETVEEANAFWDVILAAKCKSKEAYKLASEISNWFSNKAKL